MPLHRRPANSRWFQGQPLVIREACDSLRRSVTLSASRQRCAFSCTWAALAAASDCLTPPLSCRPQVALNSPLIAYPRLHAGPAFASICHGSSEPSAEAFAVLVSFRLSVLMFFRFSSCRLYRCASKRSFYPPLPKRPSTPLYPPLLFPLTLEP